MKKILYGVLIFFISVNIYAQQIKPGAEQLSQYLPLLKNKRVGVFANHSSLVGKEHLVDVLLQHHVRIKKIFAPEHGFRGDQDGKIKNAVDEKTGIPIVSLYGKKLTPTADDLKNLDVLVFDIQDVGVRFYTYISSLQKFMQAAVQYNKPLIILDRPNPNGFYVDGPVLDKKFKSFTGMQPVPLVYGMTIGEYAKMLSGEHWLDLKKESKKRKLKLTVIPCVNYSHDSLYVPPVKPSPNLSDIQSIYLYPSIGLMEATAMSVGRGTEKPFLIFGHPRLSTNFCFTPKSTHIAKDPLFENQKCYGWNLSSEKQSKPQNKIQLKYLIRAYQLYPNKNHFFRGFAGSAGNDILEKQIKMGLSEEEIRNSWQPQLNEFKKIRKKYLLYTDYSA